MKVLITGAFGGVGTEVLRCAQEKGWSVYVFELDSKHNRKRASEYGSRLKKVYWGDLRNFEDVKTAVAGKDIIIHLGAVITPLSEKLPDLSYAVNVEGTKNIITAVSRSDKAAGLVFSSSMSIMGADANRNPPLKVSDPVRISSHYTGHKIECEKLLKDSDIRWTILRLGAVLNTELSAGGGSVREMLDEVFTMSLDNRIEGIWNLDAAAAMTASAELLHQSDEICRKTFFIGGGKQNGWQLTVREFYKGIFGALGFGLPDESSFSRQPYYADWLDTEEGQFYLKYQNHTFEGFLKEMKKKTGIKFYFARLFAPIIRRQLTRLSEVAGANREKFFSRTIKAL